MEVVYRSVNQHPNFHPWEEVSTIEITNSVVVFDEILEKRQTDTSPSSLALDLKIKMCNVYKSKLWATATN